MAYSSLPTKSGQIWSLAYELAATWHWCTFIQFTRV